ncbi:MAG: septum formation protein Maf [Chloroflexi bacterium]|nr:septum formation protein Maf [Chloroflexota bacterium]
MSTSQDRLILLASASPRRRALFTLLGLPFQVATADIDETPLPGEAADAYTARLSHEKARAVQQRSGDQRALVLAADTTVADSGVILGKPADPDEARAMLRRLRGRTHQVYTALTLLDDASGRSLTDVAQTDVHMREYDDAELEAYIASGDPFDKAGGYAIQHPGFHPVEALHGCYTNVVGLPLCHVVWALRQFGVEPNPQVPLLCQRHHDGVCSLADDLLAGRL